METGFWIFMLVMDFLLPLIMVVFGKLFQHCPEEINSVFGYRTRRSMASQEAWNFAHHACGKLWFRWGLVLLPVTVGLMLLVWGAGHRHRGPLRRRGDGGATGGAAAVCGGGGKRVEADLW